MPFVRISLKEGKSPEFKQSISHAVHNALIEVFGIPSDDMFQVIEEVPAQNIIYPPSYMGIPHTDEIIYIIITAKSGRSVEMKQKLYQYIATSIHDSTGHPMSDVFIVMVENNEEDWSFGDGLAQLV